MALTDSEYLALAQEAWDEAVPLVEEEEGWKVEKGSKEGPYIVESKLKDGTKRKVYRCKATVEMSQEDMIQAIRDVEKSLEWNNTLTESKVLKKINDDVKISYQVSTSAAGGLVSAREFVAIAKAGWKGDVFYYACKGVDYEEAPKDHSLVRAIIGPGCHVVKSMGASSCHVTWLLDCQYGGSMPQSIVDLALPTAQTQFIDSMKKFAEKKAKA